MNNKHYVGRRAKSVTIGKKLPPVSGVVLSGDNDTMFVAGDETGYVVETFVPNATQQMANDLLNKMRGFEYQGYTAQNAFIPPDVELGDGITVKGVYGVLASREYSFTPKMTETISAPYENEDEHEYGYKGNYAQDIAHKVQQGQLYYGTRISKKNGLEIVKTDGDIEKSRVTLNSDTLAFYNDNGQEAFYFDANAGVFRLTQYANVEDALEGSQAFSSLELTAQQLQLELDDAQGNISSLQITAHKLQLDLNDAEGNINSLQATANSLNSQISTIDGSISYLQQTVNSFQLGVSNGTTSSTMYLYANGFAVSSANISFTGIVTFYDLSSPGGTIINGANINTGTINANSVSVNGQFQVMNGSTFVGYMGCGYGGDGINYTYGPMISSANSENYFIATGSGVRMAGGGNDIYVTAYGCFSSKEIAVHSDRRLKKDISYDLEVYKKLFRALKPCRFKMVESLEDSYHTGYIAQDVLDALNASGLKLSDFAGFVSSPKGDDIVYSLRYGEFIAIATAVIQELCDRIERLEAKNDT